MGGTRDHRRQPHQHGTLAGRTASIRSSVRSSPSWDEQSKTRCLRLEESPLVQRISFSGSAILHRKVAKLRWSTLSRTRATSSCLCKNTEGAGFPFQVESLENGIDDTVHTGYVDKADHGPGASPYLDEAAFDDIGGA